MRLYIACLCFLFVIALIVSPEIVHALWIADGVDVCIAKNQQYQPQIISDGSRGAIITWYDFRNNEHDIFAQRIDGDGNALWYINGVPVCQASNTQSSPQIAEDGSGGAIIAWRDRRHDVNRIYAQRLDSYGNSLWNDNGNPVCLYESSQDYVQVVSDGNGGAIILWRDQRNGNDDLFAQRISASGVLLWDETGVRIPEQSGHPFRSNPATHSGRFRPPDRRLDNQKRQATNSGAG